MFYNVDASCSRNGLFEYLGPEWADDGLQVESFRCVICRYFFFIITSYKSITLQKKCNCLNYQNIELMKILGKNQMSIDSFNAVIHCFLSALAFP